MVVPVQARRRRTEWVRGEQQHVPRLARRAGARSRPLARQHSAAVQRMPRVTTIHDLNYKLVPEAHSACAARGLGPARSGSRAPLPGGSSSTPNPRAVICSSIWAPPQSKVDVVPLGVTAVPTVDPTPPHSLRERFGIGDRPVVLSVSAKRPHKNLERLVRAVAAIPPERRPALVCAGYPTPHEAELRRLAAELQLDVLLPQWVSSAELCRGSVRHGDL